MPGPETAAVLAVAVAVGALVQGTVGLGLGVVTAPVVTLVDSSLMPGTMLCLAVGYPVLTLAREWRACDWRGLSWAFAGRVPGTVVGAVVVALVSTRVLGLLVGLVVLAAVVMTGRSESLPRRAGALVGAGAVSGVTGTATSIGGPPLALMYQHDPGPTVRATLAAYFLGGGLLSLAGLALGGQLRGEQVVTALVLAPFLLVGFALSGPVRRHVDAGRMRVAVLVVCATSALALVARSLLG